MNIKSIHLEDLQKLLLAQAFISKHVTAQEVAVIHSDSGRNISIENQFNQHNYIILY